MTTYGSRFGGVAVGRIHPNQRNQMYDDNVEAVTDDPTDARQCAWAALKKVVHRADGTAAMPKGWPKDYDDAKKAGEGAALLIDLTSRNPYSSFVLSRRYCARALLRRR